MGDSRSCLFGLIAGCFYENLFAIASDSNCDDTTIVHVSSLRVLQEVFFDEPLVMPAPIPEQLLGGVGLEERPGVALLLECEAAQD